MIMNLHDFLKRYFIAHNCSIVEQSDGVLTVKLTEQMDKSLMNRPFYWHYIKSVGDEPDPATLTFITNPNKRDIKGEWIHFGCTRLQQIMNHLIDNEQFVQLFQTIETKKQTPLHPWLLVNLKVSYIGSQNKDEMFSIGLNLINGVMKENMMEILQTIPLQTGLSDYCYTLSPLIKLTSGFKRIEKIIENYLLQQSHEWAVNSIQIMHEEINLVKQFYVDKLESEQLHTKTQEIKNRYTPRINFKVVNGGLIYINPETAAKLT